MPKQKKYRKFRRSVLYSLLLVAAIATVVWGIKPAINDIRSTISKVTTLRRETNELQKRLTFLDGLSEEQLRNDLVELLLGVPFGRSVPTLLVTLLDVSSKTQVNLKDFSVDASNPVATDAAEKTKKKKTVTTQIPLDVELDGDKTTIRTFLTEIQKVRRILGIERIDVVYDEGGVVSTSLSLNGYSLPLLQGGIATGSALTAFNEKEKDIISTVSQLPSFGSDFPQSPVKPAEVKPNPFQSF